MAMTRRRSRRKADIQHCANFHLASYLQPQNPMSLCYSSRVELLFVCLQEETFKGMWKNAELRIKA